VDRKGLQELSKVRLKEATALLELGLFDGAYYLAGYAVECAERLASPRAHAEGNSLTRERWSLATPITCEN
jgi:hypothetical protein